MTSQKYPIGIQTFSEIIEQGYTYVDKTGYIPALTSQGKYLFLSRPRRFGKSLLLSTLEAYFEGKRNLFKGLAIEESETDWIPSPVLHFDFNAENFDMDDGLDRLLDGYLRDFEERYGRRPEDVTLSQRFKYLIRSAFEKTGQRVVILVDEYDKPLLAVEQDTEAFERYQAVLKSFFGNLKTMDRYIRFAFITGVSRFSNVSIFSDINNLDDISLENTFSDLCGWTEEELVSYFSPGISVLASELGEDPDTTLKILRDYYDGYKFTPKGTRLYNPFSVLRALKAKDMAPYWFTSGTPTFHVRRIKAGGIYPPDINGATCTKKELMAVGPSDRNTAPLMFQTGYLTIGSYNSDIDLFTLRFPNREVEIGFYQDLLSVYVPATDDTDGPFNFNAFKLDLYEGRPEDFMRRLATLLKSLPGEDHCESTYRAITFLLSTLCGTLTLAEHHSYKGRSDLEVAIGQYVYLFEFKYDKSVREALEQIDSRDYAGRYALESRKVFLIGANFSTKKKDRGLQYEIMPL